MDKILKETSNQRILLTRKNLSDLGISYSNSHLLELERNGKFPQRITLSAHKVAWVASEVDQWFRQKMDERLEADYE